MHAEFWWGNPKDRDRLENGRLDERVIFKSMLQKWDVSVWSDLIWLTMGNKYRAFVNTVISVKCGRFLSR